MDLLIYNRELERVDRLSDKFSMARNLKYNKLDTFQLTTNLTKRNLEALQKDRVIKLQDTDELAYITNIERFAEGTKRLTVRGYGLEHYLFRRTVSEYYYAEDTVVNHIIRILMANVFNPSNRKRKIPNLRLIIDTTVGKTEVVPYQVDEDTDVLSVLNELCTIADLGYKVTHDNDDKMANLVIYKGIEKTSDNPYERPVIFSPERENILEQRLLEDNSEHKNVLLVIGQGEEDDKFKTVVGEEDKEGLDRYEGYINAQDLDPDNEGEWLSPEEYSELLKTRGKAKIKDFKPLLTYESKIHPNSNLEYRKDFNLGDIVEFQNEEWGIKETPRIVEVEEVYEDKFELRVTFGEMLPTPAEKLSQVENEAKKDKGGKVVQGGGGEVEIDLAQIKKDIKDLQINKADKKKLEEEIARLENGKADQSEIERLEKMIQEIVEGEGIKYIIPRTTSYPVRNEIFYQPKTQDKPKVRWRGDDWNSWDVSDINHLKLDDDRYYSTTYCNILENEGSITLKFEKNDRGPHILRQKRDGKNIVDTGHIRDKEKEHTLYVKPGDEISIMASFVGSVYVEYKGEESDLRLSVYKNGQIEEVANKRLIEKRLEDFTLKDELYGKVGLLDDLETEEKENIVSAINELFTNKANKEDIKGDTLVHLEKDIKEEHTVRDFENGITISAVPNTSYFPSIKKFGVVITYINKIHGGYAQTFITSDGDTWSRRTNSLSSWNKWYSNKNEIDKKADKTEVVTSVNGKKGDVIIEGGGGESIRSSTIVIANYDSHENSKKGADIVINRGENASKKINDAIQSLKGIGGEVKLMEGNYNLEYGIAVNVDGVHLTGVPNATILVQNSNWKDNPYNGGRKHIIDTMSDIDNLEVTISNLYVKGANISGSYGFNCEEYSIVNNCVSENSGSIGFYCKGRSTINNCISENSNNNGFSCEEYSIVNNCISKNSGMFGFGCEGRSTINNCISENSNNNGFNCKWYSTISNCISKNSGMFGFGCDMSFRGVCSFNILKGDKLNDNSSTPAIVQYNVIQEG